MISDGLVTTARLSHASQSADRLLVLEKDASISFFSFTHTGLSALFTSQGCSFAGSATAQHMFLEAQESHS